MLRLPFEGLQGRQEIIKHHVYMFCVVGGKKIMDMLEITVDLIEGGIHTFFLCFGLPKKEKNLSWFLKLIICLLFYIILYIIS